MDWVSLCLYLLYFFGCAIYSILAPFFPQEARARGMSTSSIGFLFSLYALIACLFAPVSGLLMRKFGRKNLIMYGAALLNTGVLLFSAIPYMSNSAFFVFVYIARVLMGMGGASLLVTCFAVLSNQFPQDVEVKIGIMETVGNVGLILGPSFGGVLYNSLGYSAVFWVYSACSLTVAFMAYHVIPPDKIDAGTSAVRKMSVLELLKSKAVFTALLVVVFGMAGPSYIEPVLAPHLIDIGVPKEVIGLAFGLPTIGYGIAVKIQSLLPKDLNRGHVLTVGLLIEGLAFLIIGEFSTYIGLSIGLVTLGLGSAWAYLPSLTYMNKSTQEQNDDIDKDALSDTLSSMMGTSHYLGEAIGPMTAGLLTNAFSFSEGALTFGLIVLTYCVIFGVLLQLSKTYTVKHVELEEAKAYEEVKPPEEPPDSFEI